MRGKIMISSSSYACNNAAVFAQCQAFNVRWLWLLWKWFWSHCLLWSYDVSGNFKMKLMKIIINCFIWDSNSDMTTQYKNSYILISNQPNHVNCKGFRLITAFIYLINMCSVLSFFPVSKVMHIFLETHVPISYEPWHTKRGLMM